MERIFALIQGSTVVNSIVADDDFVDSIKDNYTAVVETTNIEPRPGTGSAYNAETGEFILPFAQVISEPEQTAEEPQE